VISNFRLVLNVIFFLLGDSPGPEFYVLTFRNTLYGKVREGPHPIPIGLIFKDQTFQVEFMDCLTLFFLDCLTLFSLDCLTLFFLDCLILFFLDCLTQTLDHVVTAIGNSTIQVSK